MSASPRLIVWLATSFGVACVPAASIELPAGDGPRSLLLLMIDAAGAVTAQSRDLAEAPESLGGPGDSAWLMIIYPYSTEALQLGPGVITLARSGEPSRPIPEGWIALHESIPGGAGRASERAELPPALAESVRFSAFDYERCIVAGGCFPRSSPSSELCTFECEPTAPQPPARPMVIQCPVGWARDERRVLEEYALCAPALHPVVVCGPGEMLRAGAAACEPVGDPCVTRFATGVPIDLYVDAAEPPGGDGSEARPFDTIAAALVRARPFDTIGLAVGRYPESLAPRRPGIKLQGACTADTVIAPGPTTFFVVSSTAGYELRDLSIEAPEHGLFSTGPTTLERVSITNAGSSLTGVALEVYAGGSAVMRDSAIRGFGRCVSAIDASLTVEGSVIEGCVAPGIAAFTSTIVLQDVALRGHGNIGFGCSGVETTSSAASLTRVWSEGNGLRGALFEHSRVRVRDSVMRDNSVLRTQDCGALLALKGTVLDLDGLYASNNASQTVRLARSNGALRHVFAELRDPVQVRDPPAVVFIDEASTATLSESFILGNLVRGIRSTPFSRLEVHDTVVVVDGLLAGSDIDAIHSYKSDALTLRRVLVSADTGAGLRVSGADEPRVTDLQLRDVSVRNAAIGIRIAAGGVAGKLERIDIRECLTAMSARSDLTLVPTTLTDLTIVGRKPDPSTGLQTETHPFVIERFDIRDTTQALLALGGWLEDLPQLLVASDGRVEDNTIALTVAESRQLKLLMRAVKYERNLKPVELGGQ